MVCGLDQICVLCVFVAMYVKFIYSVVCAADREACICIISLSIWITCKVFYKNPTICKSVKIIFAATWKKNISILWHPCRMILFCRKTVEYCASSQRRMKVAMLTSVLSITGCCSSGPTDGIPMRFSQRSERGCQGLFIDINYGPYLTIYIYI